MAPTVVTASAAVRGPRRLWARWRDDLDSARERDPAARGRWEVALLYPGLHAVWAHRAAHALWRRGAFLPARALSQAARALTGVEIHPGAQIGDRLFIDHGAGVVIGETARVGDDVMLYHGVTLGATTQERGAKRHPTIGDRVVIGTGAAVLGDVTVGADSRIGANAVLVRSVDEHSVVVGVPGQVIASRRTPAAPADDRQDPVATTLRSLLDRVAELERRVEGEAHPGGLTMPAVGLWSEAPDYVI